MGSESIWIIQLFMRSVSCFDVIMWWNKNLKFKYKYKYLKWSLQRFIYIYIYIYIYILIHVCLNRLCEHDLNVGNSRDIMRSFQDIITSKDQISAAVWIVSIIRYYFSPSYQFVSKLQKCVSMTFNLVRKKANIHRSSRFAYKRMYAT